MRQSLVFGGLEAVARNKNHKMSNLRLFEKVVLTSKTEKAIKKLNTLVYG